METTGKDNFEDRDEWIYHWELWSVTDGMEGSFGTWTISTSTQLSFLHPSVFWFNEDLSWRSRETSLAAKISSS